MSRTSPRTIRRATAALACTILFAGAAPAAIADDLHDQQKAVQKQLASARGEFHDSSKTYAAALTRLTNAKAQLTQAQAKLARTQGDLASATAYAAVVKQKLDKRIAYFIVRMTGTRTAYICAGISLVSGLLASVIGEHTVAAMMLPVAITLIQSLPASSWRSTTRSISKVMFRWSERICSQMFGRAR